MSSDKASSWKGRVRSKQVDGVPAALPSQVIQQALHRQPSTAAQYLQQMYAAQQQHLMLQTAALQQQHLSSAQLQSLAAVQQVRAGLAGGRSEREGEQVPRALPRAFSSPGAWAGRSWSFTQERVRHLPQVHSGP